MPCYRLGGLGIYVSEIRHNGTCTCPARGGGGGGDCDVIFDEFMDCLQYWKGVITVLVRSLNRWEAHCDVIFDDFMSCFLGWKGVINITVLV